MTKPTVLPRLSARQSQLVAELVPLIQRMARVTAAMFPGVASDDLVGAGHEAAMGIAVRFDPEEGTPFWGFARKRLQGAMFEAALRERRSPARALARLMDAEIRSGAEDASGPPVGGLLDAPPPRQLAVARLRAHSASLLTALFTQPVAEAAEDTFIAKEAYVRGMSALEHALGALDKDERDLVGAFYYDGLTIDAAAARLELSRATTRRLHDRVKNKLAKLLRRSGVEETLVGEE